jgi:SAM-dependent methyltransferase
MSTDRDTGAELRSLYDDAGGVASIFSGKVADYQASRPDYPQALFDALRARVAKGSRVADLGAGTGLLTRGLLAAGYRVLAVEPNPQMRAAADFLLGKHDAYRSVNGSAESVPTPDASLDLITAAQAFHWFDIERARHEAQRVLAPGGRVALIWNDRVLDDPLHVALDEVFADFGGARRSALVAHEERHDVPRYFADAAVEELSWPHEHRLDQVGLQALVFSRSYMPDRQSPEGCQAAAQIGRIFAELANGAQIAVRYRTVLIIGALMAR